VYLSRALSVFGHMLSTSVVVQPLRDVGQQQSSAKGLIEIVQNQTTAPLGACSNRTDTGAAWVMVRRRIAPPDVLMSWGEVSRGRAAK
jgi:hypothetical protein